MKARTKWLIGAAVLTLAVGGYAMKELVFGFGEVPMSKKKELTKEEKQLAYLKEHEQEIIDFVKAQNPKIESVQIDWEETQWDDSSYPFEEPIPYISIFGKFNHIEDSGFYIQIETKDGKVDMDTIGLIDGLREGAGYFE